jgi:hypothetical protein
MTGWPGCRGPVSAGSAWLPDRRTEIEGHDSLVNDTHTLLRMATLTVVHDTPISFISHVQYVSSLTLYIILNTQLIFMSDWDLIQMDT